MRKTFLAVALATAMVVTAVPTLPVSADTAATAEAGETTTDISEVVGAEDNTAGWWTAFSKQYEIESGKSYTFNFENHGDGAANWDNYVMLFTNEAAINMFGQSENYFEYSVIRGDSWGWGGGDNMSHNGDAIVYGGTIADAIADGSFSDIIKDSSVELTIKRQDALVATEAVVTSLTDSTKSYTYTANFNLDTADGKAFFALTCEKAHLVLKTLTVKDNAGDMPDAPTVATKDFTIRTTTAEAGSKEVKGVLGANVPEAKVSVKVNGGTAVEGKMSTTGGSFTATLPTALKAGDKVEITLSAENYNDKVINLTVEAAATTKKAVKINKVTAKKGATKVTGTVSVAKATVKVKVGKKAYKAAKVTGKKFTLKVAKLTKGTKVVVKATKKNYKTATKTVTVK